MDRLGFRNGTGARKLEMGVGRSGRGGRKNGTGHGGKGQGGKMEECRGSKGNEGASQVMGRGGGEVSKAICNTNVK